MIESPSEVLVADGVRFELVRLLGRGGAGSVWHARMYRHHGLRQEVALKIADEGGASLLARLRDEARILGLLRHRAIVHLQDLVPLADGRWALVMELVDGVALSSLLGLGALPLRAALEIVAEVADALQSAAAAQDFDGRPLALTHRDVKLGNLMLCRDGRVKLLDFGIARAEFSGREAQTVQNDVFGTYGYMAPERLAGLEASTSDAYSLGVVLYELITRRRLGRTSEEPDVHQARVASALKTLEQVGIPEAARALVGRLLDHDPAHRPDLPEVRAVARVLALTLPPEDALERWAPGAVARAEARQTQAPTPPSPQAQPAPPDPPPPPRGGARPPRVDPPTAPRPALAPPPTPTALPAASNPPAPRPRAWPWRALAGSAGVLLAVVLLGSQTLRSRGTEPEPPPPPASETVARAPAPEEAPAAPTFAAASTPTPPGSVGRTRAAAPEAAPAAKVQPPPEAPAPEVVPAPAPVSAAPPPEPEPEPEERGLVQVSGDAVEVWTLVDGERTDLPAALPPGDYALKVRFGDGQILDAGVVRLGPGEVARISCAASDRTCWAR